MRPAMAVLAAALLVALAAVQVHGQKPADDVFDEDLWNLASEFLLQYHSQWPLRRLIVVFNTYKGKENYLMDLAIVLFRRFSKRGVSSSFIRISEPNAIEGLRLKEQNQPPVFCVLLLTPNEATSGFIRAASDAGGTTGDAISWIHIKSESQRGLSAEVGLRPDTNLLMVTIEKAATQFKISRWNGFVFKDKLSWDGPGKQIPADAAEQQGMNLLGQKLSVAIFHDPPFVYASNVTPNTAVKANQITGWMVDLWKDLQNVLNFTTTFYRPARLDPSAGLFRRAVEELSSGRADIVLAPFVVTASDIDEADFSMPVTDLKYRFLVPRETASSSIDQFLQPFQLLLWRVTAGTLTLAVLLIIVAYTLGRYFGFEEDGTPIFELKESVMIVYGALFAQGPDFAPNGLAARMVLWMSFAFGVVVSQAYAAALISKLTVGALEPPFTTLDGMLSSSYTPIYLPDSAPHRLVASASVGSWREMRDRKPYPRVMTRLDEAINEVMSSWTLSAVLESRERLLPLIQTSPINCKVSLVDEDILKTSGQLMLSKSSPYKAALDQQLISMRASGRLARVRSSWMGLYFEDPCPKDATLPQFNMNNVILPFAILGGGAVCSIGVLFIEYAIKKWFGRLLDKNKEDSSALQALARKHGVRLTKNWQKVHDKIPDIAAEATHPHDKTL